MPEAQQAYPLQWPKDKARTNNNRRERAKFGKSRTNIIAAGTANEYRYNTKGSLTVAESIRRLQAELDRLGARYTVVSSNVELRLDGFPRSRQAEPADPGVACYFQLRSKPIVLACDHYDRVADNIAAISEHIKAMRAMERHGVGSLEQMFAGFTALPSAISPDDWRTILGDPGSLAEAETTYRTFMQMGGHPDTGGSHEEAAAWNAAIAAARKWFAGADAVR